MSPNIKVINIFKMTIKILIIFFLTLSPAFGQVSDSLKSDSLKIEKLHETERLMWKQTEQQKIDSLIKSRLKEEIELASKDTRKREELEIKLRNIEISDSIRDAEQMEKIRALKKVAKGFPVIPFSDTVIVIYTRIGSSSASERAQAITHKIRKLYENDMFNKDSLIMVKNESGYDIAYKDEIIMSIMEEASYLTRHASQVILIHRREEFRASKIMLDRAKGNPKIKFVLNTVIEEILGKIEGDRKTVTGVRVKDVVTGKVSEIECSGFFTAIGHEPNSKIFKGILDMDETGYLITKKSTSETNVEGVFACGDVQDSYYRQAITAAGTGCMAAIDAERYLELKEYEETIKK